MGNHTEAEEMGTNCRENALLRHGQTKDCRGPSTPAHSASSFAVGQDDNMSRNMARYPIVLKDYGIVAYFARGFRYNEQALVYSGLLACNAGLASENAAFTAAYGLKDRPQ
jgi:hypothetical protein